MTWDAQAATLAAARSAVWSEPPEVYDERTAQCVALLAARLDLADGDEVLDLGCGIGRLTLPFARQHPGARFVGYDTSAAMLAHARAAADVGNVTWQHGGPLPSCTAAFSMVAVQHMPPDVVAGYLAELGALGARVVFQYVEGDHHEGDDHRYPAGTMAGMLTDAGLSFTVERGLMYREWAWVSARPA